MLLFGHVQGLVDTVIEEGILPDALFKREAVQQVRVEKQRPARQHHLLPIVLVIILAAAVCQVYLRLIVEEDAVHTVIIQAVAHGRHLGIVNDADQRMLLYASNVAGIVVDVPYFQYLAHNIFVRITSTICGCLYPPIFAFAVWRFGLVG